MKPIDMLRLAVTSLRRRKTRTALTVLGVVIGTACIVMMVALGLGSMDQFNRTVAGSATLTEIRVMAAYGAGSGSTAATIDDKAIAAFRALPGVKGVSPVLDIPAYVRVGRYEAQYIQLTAIDPEGVPPFQLKEGSLFSAGSGVPQIVMGSNAGLFFTDSTDQSGGEKAKGRMKGQAETEEPAGPDVDWINEPAKITFGGKNYALSTGDTSKSRIYRGSFCGVMKADQSERSYSMYISLNMARTMIRENLSIAAEMGIKLNSYTSALVYADDLDTVLPLLQSIKDMGYEAYSPTEYIETARAEQRRQQGQLSMMAVISLLVSAIGIANTMLAGILERGREIGVMKVVGLSIARIRIVFLLEAGAIGMAGGLAGLLLSYAIAFFINGSTEQAMVLGMQFQSGVKLIIPLWLSAGGVAISVAVGLVSGIYPAVKATRMSPLEAIRGV